MLNIKASSLEGFTRLLASALFERGAVSINPGVLRDALSDVFKATDWDTFQANLLTDLEKSSAMPDYPVALDTQRPPIIARVRNDGDMFPAKVLELNAWFAQATKADIVELYRLGFAGKGSYNDHLCADVLPDEDIEDYEALSEDERTEFEADRNVCHRMLEWMALVAHHREARQVFHDLQIAKEGFGFGDWELKLDAGMVFAWLELHRPDLWRHLLCLAHDIWIAGAEGASDCWSWLCAYRESVTTFASAELAERDAVEILDLKASMAEGRTDSWTAKRTDYRQS